MSLNPVTGLHLLSIVISSAVLGLSTVNFGVLCVWINASVSFLVILYHATTLFITWRRNSRKAATPTPPPSASLEKKYASFADLKMPTHPPPAYSPDNSSEKSQLSPNRYITPIHIPTSPVHLAGTDGENSSCRIPSGPFYAISSLFSITTLTIISLVAFAMTVDLSIRGAKNAAATLLPAQGPNETTFPWNRNVQTAQCTFLSGQLLLCFVTLVVCVIGRSKRSRVEKLRRGEIEYGLASPRESDAVNRWYEGED